MIVCRVFQQISFCNIPETRYKQIELEQLSAIEQEGYRAIVDTANVHMLAESSFCDSYPPLLDQVD